MNDAVCSQRERRVEKRLGEETAEAGLEVCDMVGLPTRDEYVENVYYGLVESEFDYEAMESDFLDESSSKSAKAR